MGLLTQLRTMVLLSVVISSIIVIGINANYLAFSNNHWEDDDSDSDDGDDSDDEYDGLRHKLGFAVTGLAIAALSVITVVPLLILHLFRSRSRTSTILFEIGWVSVLMILWIAVAGQTTTSSAFRHHCDKFNDKLISLCQQYQALQAFSWMTFIILLLWLAVVFVIAAMAHTRGHTKVWLYSFHDAVRLSRLRDREDNLDGKLSSNHSRAMDTSAVTGIPPPSYISPAPYYEGYQPVYAYQGDYIPQDQNLPVVYHYPEGTYAHPQFQTVQYTRDSVPQV